MADFEVYRLPEEHDAIREAVRAVCEGKVAPSTFREWKNNQACC